MDTEQRMRALEHRCEGMFANNKDRDLVILATFVMVVLYLVYLWWQSQQAKSGLDNRPFSIPLQVLDHTGATNYAPFKRHGLVQALKPGMKTISSGDVDFYPSGASLTLAGKTQTEMSGTTLESRAKQGLDRREKLTPKTVDAELRKQLH